MKTLRIATFSLVVLMASLFVGPTGIVLAWHPGWSVSADCDGWQARVNPNYTENGVTYRGEVRQTENMSGRWRVGQTSVTARAYVVWPGHDQGWFSRTINRPTSGCAEPTATPEPTKTTPPPTATPEPTRTTPPPTTTPEPTKTTPLPSATPEPTKPAPAPSVTPSPTSKPNVAQPTTTPTKKRRSDSSTKSEPTPTPVPASPTVAPPPPPTAVATAEATQPVAEANPEPEQAVAGVVQAPVEEVSEAAPLVVVGEPITLPSGLPRTGDGGAILLQSGLVVLAAATSLILLLISLLTSRISRRDRP